jgi:hypothetical protein
MFIEIIWEAITNSLTTVVQIGLIVFPIMIVLRFAREAEILNKVSNYFEPLTKKIYLSKEATFPLIVGTVFGLTYGAGVIVQAAKEGRLTARDMLLINVFLGLNHAIFEDTVIFAAIGANPWWLLTTRLLLAILITYLVGRWLVSREKISEEVMLD